MREFLWRAIASIASQPRVAAWLIERAQRTPYYPITARGDDSVIYMDRWWLFNAYGKGPADEVLPPSWQWLPSIRVHHIQRADDDGHLHDHPWNARTIVLRGGYVEEKPVDMSLTFAQAGPIMFNPAHGPVEVFVRGTGYTGRVLFEHYHRIRRVSAGGVFTLWFTWRYRGTWGFMVDGAKVPYKTYLDARK